MALGAPPGFTGVRVPSVSADLPLPPAGEAVLFHRSDTGRVRTGTSAGVTDAGFAGPQGIPGGQEIDHAEAATQQSLTPSNNTYQDVTGLQIVVPAGSSCLLIAYFGLSVTSAAALGTLVAPVCSIRDTANTVIAGTNPSIMLPASGTNIAVKYPPLIKRIVNLGATTTYKFSVNPTASASISTIVTYTTTNADPLFLRAQAI